MADDLVESGINKSVELDLWYRSESLESEADRDPDDRGLGQRRVEYAIFAELLLQTVSDPEHSAQASHVLSEDQHPVVVLHRIPQPGGDRPGKGDGAHPAGSREAEKASRSSSNAAGAFSYTPPKMAMVGSGARMLMMVRRIFSAIVSASRSTAAACSSFKLPCPRNQV